MPPSQIDVEDAVGLDIGSNKTEIVLLTITEFVLISERVDSAFVINLAFLISVLLADESNGKRLKNIATNK